MPNPKTNPKNYIMQSELSYMMQLLDDDLERLEKKENDMPDFIKKQNTRLNKSLKPKIEEWFFHLNSISIF
tara:strand:- start:115 stop:327 length:213 start_codon:yes stop_codon:yes gene_type:complete